MPKKKEYIVDVIDALCEFAEVMKDATKEDMLANNPEYLEKVASLKEKQEQYHMIMKGCPTDRRIVIQGYMVDMMDKHCEEGDCFYLRGYQDCIMLLNQLNLFK